MTTLNLNNTLLDPVWVGANRKILLDLLPETWTHIANLNLVRIGYTFKLLGIDWRSNEDLAQCFALLERGQLLLRDGVLLRRANL